MLRFATCAVGLSLFSIILLMSGCDHPSGTCCCEQASGINGFQDRAACSKGGGICTNINVCASQGPSASPTPTPSPSPTPNSQPVIIPPTRNFSFGDKSPQAPAVGMKIGIEPIPEFCPMPNRISNDLLPAAEITWEMERSSINDLLGKSISTDADPSQCDSQCAADGPFCLKATLKDNNGLVGKVERVRALMTDRSTDKITPDQFMKIFDVGSDPCGRKETLLTPSLISNSGQPCRLDSSLGRSAKTFNLAIQLPAKLEGNREIQNDNLILGFADPTKAPTLIIGDGSLDRDFGGRVLRVSAGKNAGIITTAKACIAVKLRTSVIP